MWGDGGADKLSGGEGADTLWGDSGKDVLAGGTGNDALWAGSQDDVLLGGDGNDFLEGGGNNDELTGGNGSDTFRFAPWSGHDVITDYHSQDRIEFKIDGLQFDDLTISN